MSADHRTLIAEALGRSRMTPYEDGKGGWLFRSATATEQAAALLDSPEFAAVLADVRAGAWDEGHQRGLRDADLQHEADNPYRADERTSHE